MAEAQDRLNLLITVNADGAVSVLKGFSNTATTELKKVETAAATSGANAGKQFGSGLLAGAQSGVAAFASLVGTLGTVKFAESAIQQAVQLDRANAALAVQLKSTNFEAGTTAGGIDRLADHIEKTQAIYAGSVKAGAAYLLTLREIKNQTGEGNDIFNRALETAAGMSNVLGKDLTTTVTQLGRALENPAAGTQALQRAGATLDAQTKSLVVHLAEQGKLLDAQRVLLDDLGSRYIKAGESIAKADPIQQFNVQLQELKQQIGHDLLPAITPLLEGTGKLLDGFGKLPVPLRITTEALVGIGVALPVILKIKSALDALTISATNSTAIRESLTAVPVVEEAAATGAVAGVSGAGAAAAGGLSGVSVEATAAAESLEGLAPSGAAATEALEATGAAAATAAAELASVGPAGAIAGEGLAAAGEGAAGSAAGLGAAGAAGISLGGVFAAGAAGIASFVGTYAILQQTMGGHDRPFQELQRDVDGVAKDIEDIAHKNTLGKLFHIPTLKQDQKDIQDPNAGFSQILDTQGPEAAARAYGTYANSLHGAGVSMEDIGSQFGPFLDNLAEAQAAAAAAAGTVDDLSDAFKTFAGALEGIGDRLKIQDKFDAADAARSKLKEDFKDFLGIGDKAQAAAKAERDAWRGLADAQVGVADANQRLADSHQRVIDAQQKVIDSTHQLQEAQQALDDFNSARGQRERDLKAAIIDRRVVTTPQELFQKELDQLELQDQNKQKQQSLTDAVTSAQKNYADAIRGVADANRGVADAERGVQDATQRVADAEDNVKEATKKRQQLHHDASEAMVADNRKVEEAYIDIAAAIESANEKGEIGPKQLAEYGSRLDDIAKKYGLGGELGKAVDDFYKRMIFDQAVTGTGPVAPPNAAGLNPDYRYSPSNYGSPNGFTASNPAPNPAVPPQGSGITGSGYFSSSAEGNIFADHPGIAKLYNAHDGTRIFNEPEAGGEAYIPLGSNKRARSVEILRAVADRFGFGVKAKHFANGGILDDGLPGIPQLTIVQTRERAGAPTQNHALTVNQTNNFNGGDTPTQADLDYANRQLGWRLSRMGRN